MKKVVLATVVVVAIAVGLWYFAQTERETEDVGSMRGSEEHGITGTITFAGEVPSFQPLDMSADPICAELNPEPVYPEVMVLGEGKTLGNVYVQVLNPPPGEAEVPSDEVHIAFQDCMYSPRIVAVMTGQRLIFRNGDETLHNIHGLPKTNVEFNIGQPFQGMEHKRTFSEPEGPFEVKDDVHPWEQAYIAVVAHPYFAITDEDGRFEIAGLPDGTYEVQAWHERFGTQQQTVTISGGSAKADFSFQAP